jgi:WD40 repeat protein
MIIRINAGNTVEGKFIWIARYAPGYPASHLGVPATEFFRGNYYPEKGILEIEGYRREDPRNVIALDRYRLALSVDGETLAGASLTGRRDWSGRIELRTAREDDRETPTLIGSAPTETGPAHVLNPPDGHSGQSGAEVETSRPASLASELLSEMDKYPEVQTRLINTISSDQPIAWATISPDGRWVAAIIDTYRDEHFVRIWNAASGHLVREIIDKTACATSIAFSPDGRMIAIGNNFASVNIWDILSGDRPIVLIGHNDHASAWPSPARPDSSTVHTIVYSPDGRYIATCASDLQAIIWESATGRHLHSMDGIFHNGFSSISNGRGIGCSFGPNSPLK